MMNTNISLENLNQFEQGFDTNPTNALAMNAVGCSFSILSGSTPPRRRAWSQSSSSEVEGFLATVGI